jgi:outer membrane protein OmpA-like peptidoglycan-associated protein
MNRIAMTLLLAVSFAGFPAAAGAEEMSTEQIIDSLKPKQKTRSLKGEEGGLNAEQQGEIKQILTRKIGVIEREKVKEIVEKAKLPKLDFEIYFEYDSAEIKPESLPVLDKLGAALKDPALATSNYLVNGHTDAKGSDSYNQELSERRAAAVVAYLAGHHYIEVSYLKAIGYGESQPRDPAYPENAANRRVEIVNLSF